MNKLSVVLAIVAVLALVVPASADAWVQKTNITQNGRLWSTGGDLYYFNGTVMDKYNPVTDTWTAQTASPVGRTNNYVQAGSKFINNADAAVGGDGKLYVYDPASGAGGSWTLTSAAPYDHWLWAQQVTYDPYKDKVAFMWSDKEQPSGPEYFYTSLYDMTTDTWGKYVSGVWTPWDGSEGGKASARWTGGDLYANNGSAQIGNTVYSFYTTAAIGRLVKYDATQVGNFGKDGSWTITASWDLANDDSDYESLVTGDPASWKWTTMLAVDGTDIYITGVDGANAFIVYDSTTNTWSYPQDYFPAGVGHFQDHSVAVAGDYVYRQQYDQLWAWNIPEPGTMALLGLGGLAVVIRRRRRS